MKLYGEHKYEVKGDTVYCNGRIVLFVGSNDTFPAAVAEYFSRKVSTKVEYTTASDPKWDIDEEYPWNILMPVSFEGTDKAEGFFDYMDNRTIGRELEGKDLDDMAYIQYDNGEVMLVCISEDANDWIDEYE
jgi:hypothetical protein